MTLDLGHTKTATIDHVDPKSKGGLSKEYNEVAACSSCNTKKANMSLRDFLVKTTKWRKLKQEEFNFNR